MNRIFELGLNSFGEVAADDGGRQLSDAETVRLLVDEARLAESAGLDRFSVGEHYREGHTDSAPPVLLAAIAPATERIQLGTSVTVLSTNDPVRLYHEYSTLDAVSNGRAEVILGRGSATESFPLFGYDLADYERLFEEKLDLFMRLQREQQLTWSGTVRSPLVEQRLHPVMRPGGIPTWIGVGGNPNSVLRAARYGLPLMLAIIGGRPQRFARHVELYERGLEQFGLPINRSVSTPSASLPIPTTKHGRPGCTGSRSSSRSHGNAASTHPLGSGTRPRSTAGRCSSARPRPSPTRSRRRPATCG
jgi:alkanesulfonate monooxygenase SsuD/methylene tetrahydromethanopterin reductase-like flavin-dependent oxidoreductase (luciferase family)